jgi:5-methyltetrahydropteroyltriglutamate--homocysteine methyltransferase
VLTATKDLMLPATVTGSWPRPRWFTEGLWGRPMHRAMLDLTYREQFSDALAALLVDQERAGLDILTNGDYFHDQDLGGFAWMHYAVERWSGFDRSGESRRLESPYSPGTLLNEIGNGWRWPYVVGKVDADPMSPLDYPLIHRAAQQRTAKPVKFGTASPQCISKYLDIRTESYASDKRQLIWDMTMTMNQELRDLQAAGCRVIQIEEPIIHMAVLNGSDDGLVDFLVDAWNAGLEGLDESEIWIHTCWGNPNMQRIIQDPSYEKSIEIYLERMRGDVWTIEMKDSNFSELALFAPWKGRLPKKVATGVVSHRRLQVETAEEVAGDIRRALKYIDADQLVLSSDCGFGRQGCDRMIAQYKAAAIARGRNIILDELGLDERPVRIAVQS